MKSYSPFSTLRSCATSSVYTVRLSDTGFSTGAFLTDLALMVVFLLVALTAFELMIHILIVNFNHAEGLMLMTTDFDAGVLLFSATWFTGTRTFASGK